VVAGDPPDGRRRRLRPAEDDRQAACLQFVLEIIRRRNGQKQKGVEVLPRRWVVEWTIGWMIRWRRLVRDYERRIGDSITMIRIAMGSVQSIGTLILDSPSRL